MILRCTLTDFITLGVREATEPTVVSPSPSDVLKEYKKITYAQVYWLVKPSAAINQERACFPLMAAFYLDPHTDKWLCAAVARANVWKESGPKPQLIY